MGMDEIDYFNFGKRITLDVGVDVQLKLEGVGFALQSTVVGMEPGEYLIIKSPKSFVSIKHKCVPGSEMVVRYLHNGTVYGFQTKLIEFITSPTKLFFLEYPRIIEHHDLRHEKRFPCHFPARLKLRDGRDVASVISDISQNGCRCLIDMDRNHGMGIPHIDDQVSFSCQFPGVQGAYVIAGTVRNISKARSEIVLGVEFAVVEDEINNILARYVFSL